MIEAATREKIKGFLEGFLEVQLQKHQKAIQSGAEEKRYKTDAKAGKLKPFHLAILPPEAVRLSSFERSFSTSLGNTFEECAKLIALDFHQEVARSHILTGRVSRKCLSEIERVRSLIDRGHAIDYPERVSRVIKANAREDVEIRTDARYSGHGSSQGADVLRDGIQPLRFAEELSAQLRHPAS